MKNLYGNCFSRRSGAKKKYWDEQEAKVAARNSERDYKEPMRAYPCPHCGAWHVGSCKK